VKILCTGGAGYVGSACLRWLLKHGHDAVAYDNLSEGNQEAVPEGRLIVGDILDRAALTQAIKDHGSEAVMHFAAVASVPESINDPDLYYRINVIGTKYVLDAMRDCGVELIVFSSTAATYAFTDQMPLTEESDQAPQVPYGTTKLSAEWMINDYRKAYGIGYTLLRYFNASGADPDGGFGEDHRDERHLIPLTLQVALGKREKLLVYGKDFDTRDGSCIRDYVHTDDLGQAHQLAIEALKPGEGHSYNLGNGNGTSVLEVVQACERISGQAIQYDLVGPRPGDPATLVTSPDKIIGELGWSPQYSDINQIVETTWRWHQMHPDGYAGSKDTAQVSA